MAQTRPKAKTARKSAPRRAPAPPPPTWDERLIHSLIPWRLEMAAGFVCLLALITLLGLAGLTSTGWLAWWTGLLRQLAGWGAYAFSMALALGCLHLMLRRKLRLVRLRPGQIIGLELILLAALPLSFQISGATLAQAYLGRGGGLVGWALAAPLVEFLGPLLTAGLHLALLLWGVGLLANLGWNDALEGLMRLSRQLQRWAAKLERQPTADGRPPVVAHRPAVVVRPAAREAAPLPDLVVANATVATGAQPKRRDRSLPPLTLLEEGQTATWSEEELETKKEIIERTLRDFDLPVTVTQVRRGPAVTQFGVEPGYIERPGPDGQPRRYKVRVGQIAALNKDLALALAAPRLRVEAPVPGRGVVGIEVPNVEISLVRLRPVLESDTYQKVKSHLAVGLGRDVSGVPVATDLAKLPHLLIAGTTGAGKSVCINALVTCLVVNNRPEELKLVMMDPKKVELTRFNGLPHLLGKVEVEHERIIGVLRWLTAEMDRRYEQFSAMGAKHLADYNRKIRRLEETQPLPYVVVFIDELADLMAAWPADTERTICRLAQMARATGIHLVVATQRPSTDVITGLIKANFPARIAFAVASGIDSRVILDTVGAEHLLGKGDMLFLSPDAAQPVRVQGCLVSDTEIERVVAFWQEAQATEGEAAAPTPAPWESLIARQAAVEGTDDLLEQAIALAQKYDTISASFLQRRLRLGYPRAARLMEALYEMGMVEDPKVGGRTRRTFVSQSDEDPLADYLAQNGDDKATR